MHFRLSMIVLLLCALLANDWWSRAAAEESNARVGPSATSRQPVQPALLRKDIDLGLAAGHANGVPMPVTAATREALQAHFGAATLQPDPQAYLDKDFSALLETLALAAGMKLESENVPVPTGLDLEG